MNCVDCETILRRNTPAIAVCTMCGAGLCTEHALTPARHDPAQASGGRPQSRGHASLLSCYACSILGSHG
ncbi:DUF2180 family protein [Pengzhenrongella sp.]|uniref:DUF2180 family protein n=1 Tax=Pengzhenrongella sp. TaxID=2888820 RepID=UPI0039C8DA79